MSTNEVIFEGIPHLSVRKASEITKYTPDYVGQLCRSGKIRAKRIGRAWYVDKESLLKHWNENIETSKHGSLRRAHDSKTGEEVSGSSESENILEQKMEDLVGEKPPHVEMPPQRLPHSSLRKISEFVSRQSDEAVAGVSSGISSARKLSKETLQKISERIAVAESETFSALEGATPSSFATPSPISGFGVTSLSSLRDFVVDKIAHATPHVSGLLASVSDVPLSVSTIAKAGAIGFMVAANVFMLSGFGAPASQSMSSGVLAGENTSVEYSSNQVASVAGSMSSVGSLFDSLSLFVYKTLNPDLPLPGSAPATITQEPQQQMAPVTTSATQSDQPAVAENKSAIEQRVKELESKLENARLDGLFTSDRSRYESLPAQPSGGVSGSFVSSKLALLEATLRGEIAQVSQNVNSLASRAVVQGPAYYPATPPTNRIDTLTNVIITAATINNPTITNATLSGGTINNVTINNPTSPATFGSTTVAHLSVTENFENIANLSSNPVVVGTISGLGNLYGVAIQGKYVYTLDQGTNSMYVIDASKPNSPAIVGTLTGLNGPYGNLAVQGKYVYATNYNGNTMVIVDVSNPSTPTVVGQVGVTTPWGMAVSGGYAYVVGLGNKTLYVVDISNPRAPVVRGTTPTLGFDRSVFVSGKYAYVPNVGSSGDQTDMHVIDISNPSVPTKVGLAEGLGAQAYDVYVSGRYAYVTAQVGNSLSIVDISNPVSPTVVGVVTGLNGPRGVSVSGRYAYVGNTGDGIMRVIDVSNPASPSVVGTVGSGYIGSSVAVSGRYVYAAGGDKFSVIDIGGMESTSAIVHSLEVGNLQARSNINAQGNLSVGGGLNIGSGGLFSGGAGSFSVIATSSFSGVSALSSILSDSSTSTVLDVVKLGRDSLNTAAAGIGTGLLFTTINSAGAQSNSSRIASLFTNTTSGSEASALTFSTRNAAAFTEKMRIDNLGNVGIGTTSPAAKFQVYSTSNDRALFLENAFSITPDYTAGTRQGAYISTNSFVQTGGWDAVDTAVGSWVIQPIARDIDNMSSINFRYRNAGASANTGPTVVAKMFDTGGMSLGSVFTNTNAPTGGMIIQGNVGVGTTSPYSRLSVAGLATDSVSPLFSVSSSTPTGTTTVFTINSQGLVGIGVTPGGASSSDVLEIAGNASSTQGAFRSILTIDDLTPMAQGVGGGIRFRGINTPFGNTTLAGIWAEKDDGIAGHLGGSLNFMSRTGAVGDTNAQMSLSSLGNIGIGTTSPYAMLSISNNVNTPANRPLFAIASTTGGISTSTLFTILANGNVVIGTTTSAYQLQVGNGAYLDGRMNLLGSQPFLRIEDTDTATYATNWIFQAYNGRLRVLGGTVGEVLSIASSTGNVGIGTTSPYTKFAVVDGTGEMRFQNVSQANLTVTGTNASVVVDSSIGTSYPGFILKKGGVNMGTIAANDITGIQLLNASGNGITVLGTTGNIGIGTTSPSGKLTVDAASAVVNSVETAGALVLRSTTAFGADIGPQMRFSGETGSGLAATTPYAFATIAGRKENATANNLAGYLQFSTTQADSSIVERMRITSTGNVGIGTTTPTGLGAGGAPTILQIHNNNTGPYTPGSLVLSGNVTAAGSYVGQIVFGSSGITGSTNQRMAQIHVNKVNSDPTDPAATMSFLTANGAGNNPITRMIIDNLGNVGIGTTSPYAMLSVSGNIVADSISATSTTATSTFGGSFNVGNGDIFYDYNSGTTSISNLITGSMGFESDAGVVSWTDLPVTSASALGTIQSYTANIGGNPMFTIFGKSDGAGGVGSTSVGIASTSPWGLLSVNPTNTLGSSPQFVVGSSSATSFIVASTSYVGINTSNPAYPLDVNGSLRVNGTILGTGTANLTIKPNTSASAGDIIFQTSAGVETMRSMGVNSPRMTFGYAGSELSDLPGGRVQIIGSNDANQFALGIGKGDLTPILYVKNDGSIGIGTSSPLARLDVFGSNNGTSPLFQLSSVAGFATTSRFLVTNSGNVGIGTTSPNAKLQVAGSAGAGAISITDTGSSADSRSWWLQSYNPGTGNSQLRFRAENDAASSGINALIIERSGISSVTSYFENGNVGIGTTSPYAKLSVVGPVVAEYFHATSTTATTTLAGGLDVNSGGLTYDYSTGITSAANFNMGAMNFDTDAGIIQWVDMPVTSDSAAGTIESYTASLNSNPVLTVFGQADGIGGMQNTRVGVGTSTPYAKLTVWSSTTTAENLFQVVNSASTTLFSVSNDASAIYMGKALGLGTTTTTSMLEIQASTNVLIRAAGDLISGQTVPAFRTGNHLNSLSYFDLQFTQNTVATSSRLDIEGNDVALLSLVRAGNVGIGTTSPWAKFAINPIAGDTNQFVVGSSTATSLIITPGGTVGIGTTTPGDTTRFFVQGETRVRDGAFVMDASGTTNLTVARLETTSNNGLFRMWNASGVNQIYLHTAGNSYFNGGNVGIGTTTPGALFQVHSSGAIRLSNSTTATDGLLGGIDFNNTNAEGAATNARIYGVRGDAALEGRLTFETRDGATLSERMRIDENGNVGIGTTTPLAKLQVGTYDQTSYTEMAVFSGAKSAFVGIPTNQLAVVDTTAMAAGVGGEISLEGAFSTASVGSITSFAGIGGVKENGTSGNYGGNFIVKTRINGGNLAEALRVDSSQRVGIGTTTPGAALDVIGALCVDDATPTCGNSARTAGTIYSVAALSATLDLAESYPTKDQSLSPGEIVMLDPVNPIYITRAELTATTSIAIGIVSTKPGFYLGGFNDELYPDEKKVPLALAGRVPTKVSTENGMIKKGDFISLSSTPGVGMKATSSGYTVGIALEDFDGSANGPATESTSTPKDVIVNGSIYREGVITVFVNVSYSKLDNVANGELTIGDFWKFDATKAKMVAQTNVDLSSHDLTGVRSIVSDSGLWSIDANGRLIVENIEVRGTIKVGTPTRRTGITLYDEVSGLPYCVSLSGGAMKQTAGDCPENGYVDGGAAAVGSGSTGTSGSTTSTTTDSGIATTTEPVVLPADTGSTTATTTTP